MTDITDKISYPGQVDVIDLNIISSNNLSYDISAIVADLTLYEDIFSNTMSGYALLEDSVDLISGIPLLGQELLRVTLKTPTLTQKITKDFYIYKLQHRTTKKRNQTYMINFCSRELIASTNSKVSQAFSGLISDTVTTIFKDSRYIGSSSKFFAEKTKNTYSFIAPFWTPLETINWVTAKSLNTKGVPNYLFYETNKSFEFVSVDALIGMSPKRDYVFSDVDANTYVGIDGDKENKYDVVEFIENTTTFDYLRNLSAGMYASKLYTLDVTTKNINVDTFDYIDMFNKSNHLNNEPLKMSNLIRKKIASLYFIEKNNYQTGIYKPQGYKDFFLQRNSLLEQLSAFKFVIKVHGRTDMKAGDVVNFTAPNLKQILADEIETDINSSYFSGKYLVTAIRHQIISGVHSMHLEIVKDSFIKKLL